MTQYSTEKRNTDYDEFLTPPELIRAIAQLTTKYYPRNEQFRILDAGCNTGQWGNVFREVYPNSHIVGVEIMDTEANDNYNEWYSSTDFLAWSTDIPFDLVVGNPPYSLRLNNRRISVAEPFVRKALSLLTEEGHLYFLLNTNLRHSRERLWKDRRKRTVPGLHQEYHYKECHAVIPRPSFYRNDSRMGEFYNSMKTNAHNYDVYVWSRSWKAPWGISLELDWEYE